MPARRPKVYKIYIISVISKHGKKAIQFGTKIAKLSNKRFFGGNKRAKGTANYNIK